MRATILPMAIIQTKAHGVGYSLLSDELEVFLPKYSQTAILHAAHFRRVVNPGSLICLKPSIILSRETSTFF